MKNDKQLVLIVEDDFKLLESLKDYFEKSSFEVICAKDGEEAIDIFFSNSLSIDVILLDGMLPKMDGFDVLKEIRERSDVPIIMITARESEEEQLYGLQNGVDIYITKPFRLSVLRAHVEAILRRKALFTESVIKVNDLELNTGENRAYILGEDLNLTTKEYMLLEFFVNKKNLVLSREKIIDGVWGCDYDGDYRTVDTLVKQLRKKLGKENVLIQSVYGAGYRFGEMTNE